MAEDRPEQQPRPEEESKKDTVRINLPPGMTGRPGAPAVKIKPGPEDEAKKETAVMGKPAATPKPKADTSRVEVAAAKPTVPEMPRPTVKLRQADTVAPVTATTAAPARPAAQAVAVSGGNPGMTVAAMVLSILVLAYLAVLALG
jgi:hypothetical protein